MSAKFDESWNEGDLSRYLIASIHDYAIFMLDGAGRVASWNSGAERILGYRASDILGKHVSCFFTPEDVRANLPQLELETAAATGSASAEGWRVRRDGACFWGSGVVHSMSNQGLRGFVKVLRDLTERKLSEDRLREEMEIKVRLYEQSRTLSRELQRQNEELADADRRKNEFLAMLGHELRNPLAPIASSLHIIQNEKNVSPAVLQAANMAERQVRQLTSLVDDLIDVARITRGTIQLHIEHVMLSDVLTRAVETVQPIIELQQHNLSVSYPRFPIWLNADALRVQQIVINLLTNAAKYTPRGGDIVLSANETGDTVEIVVRDNGVGITAELLGRVFDLFTQAERTLARSEGGLGVGLTIVKRLAAMHGGSVEARSAGLGQGSEFIVRLPIAVVDDVRPQAMPQEIAQPPHEVPLRVLVVDDNQDAASSMATMLRSYGHEIVGVAHDGSAALQMILEKTPDVVLLDIGLPVMDGYEVANQVRTIMGDSQIRLVAVTGYGLQSDRQKSSDAGFDEHLVKPVHPDQLQTALTAKLNHNSRE